MRWNSLRLSTLSTAGHPSFKTLQLLAGVGERKHGSRLRVLTYDPNTARPAPIRLACSVPSLRPGPMSDDTRVRRGVNHVGCTMVVT